MNFFILLTGPLDAYEKKEGKTKICLKLNNFVLFSAKEAMLNKKIEFYVKEDSKFGT